MKLNMNPLTELALLIIVFCLHIEEKISNLFSFEKKPVRRYQYFSSFLIGTFPGLVDEKSHREIESISDNIRYDSVSDTWELFKISHDNYQDMDIHQGRRGNWIIVDDEQRIRKFKEMYFQGINSLVTPTVQI